VCDSATIPPEMPPSPPPLQQPSAIHFDNTGNLTFAAVDEINIYPCE